MSYVTPAFPSAIRLIGDWLSSSTANGFWGYSFGYAGGKQVHRRLCARAPPPPSSLGHESALGIVKPYVGSIQIALSKLFFLFSLQLRLPSVYTPRTRTPFHPFSFSRTVNPPCAILLILTVPLDLSDNIKPCRRFMQATSQVQSQ